MHRNFVLLVDAIDWDVNYQDLINKVACDSSNKECTPPRFLLGGASIFFFFLGGGGGVGGKEEGDFSSVGVAVFT